ncbi:DUF4403 family protein [Cytophagaceae bacterium YF14B1]|uniref:DUF4403 family protein n=1 Tax=Xanthocytophaga flava TaxID=3048013 RepID=A0AAE3QYB3_9BACT|nr:DUF4403 family protein [Xanthocytophaga flavus]MDJ1484718.1 DUF4403 family protein [Xanthocytophaga flavus]
MTLRIFGFVIVILVVAVVLFWGCKPARLEPKQPEEKYTDTQVTIPRLLSVVNIPVTISVAEIERQINAQVKDLIFEDNSLEDNGKDDLLLKVWKREPIQIESGSEVFRITVPLKIWAKKGIKVLGITTYKETTFSLNARFVSTLHVNSDWQVVASTMADGYDWIEKPYVRLGFIEIPITGIISQILDREQQNIAGQMDNQLKEQLALKMYVQQVWQAMQQPLQVSKQYDAWVKVTPLEVWMTPLLSNETTVKAQIGIKAYTETMIGKKPVISSLTPLPALQIHEQAEEDFQLGLTGEISHQAATQIAISELVGKTFEFQNGSRKITIISLDLYGNGSNLVIKTGITGSLDGTLYLVGKPYFNPQTQSIELKNMDFSLDTKDRLVKAANWLAHGTLVKKMQENIKIPLKSQLELAKKNLQAQLENKQLMKGISLNGKLEEFSPGDVIITPETIVAVVTAKGKLDIKIDGL